MADLHLHHLRLRLLHGLRLRHNRLPHDHVCGPGVPASSRERKVAATCLLAWANKEHRAARGSSGRHFVLLFG
jgi:hypothetical protein